jgi:DNA-binding MarR family transcriptional regulator
MSSADSNGRAWRRLVAASVLFSEALAEQLRINPTDLKCVQLAAGEEGMTPTRLAELAGITTGAITGVLDRLERAGIAKREPDPTDRRSVVVRIDEGRVAEISALYAPLLDALAQTGASAEVVEAAASAIGSATERLRVASRGGWVAGWFEAPLGEATQGRLVVSSGAPRLTFNANALGQQARMVVETSASRLRLGPLRDMDKLVRARFDGPEPEVRASDGVVTVRYKRGSLLFASRAAQIELSSAVPWTIQLDGGITDFNADLEAVRLAGLELLGGANHLTLELPRPERTVRIAIAGGVNRARIHRPANTAASLRVRGGASHLRFDDTRMESGATERTMRSDDFAGAVERYEIDLAGGASHLSLTRG